MSGDETLLELAARCETAERPDQELFDTAFVAVHGPKPPRVHGGSTDLGNWLASYNRFYDLMKSEAWLDAALMLVPERGVWTVASASAAIDAGPYAAVDEHIAEAATPALALCAAALRAKDRADG